MKKRLSSCACSFILCLFLSLTVACSQHDQKAPEQDSAKAQQSQVQNDAASKPESKTEISFTDQVGAEVRVQVPVERMVVMQHHSLDMLAQLGQQDKVVAAEKNWKGDLGDYITDVFPQLQELPTPGDLQSLNVEEVAKLQPDIVIVASQANPEQVQKLRDLNIPVCTISLRGEGKQAEAQNPRLSDADKAYTEGCEWAIKTLGKLTGTQERADKIWAFAEESRKYVEDTLTKVPDDQLVRAFIANKGEKTYGNDKYVGCQLLRAGGINVAAQDIQGYKPYTFEQLANWDPAVIFVQDRYKDVYDQIISDPKYQELKAVKDGKVILAPYWTKPWGNPDTDSIALGEPWLAHKLYPEQISSEYVLQRAQAFYKEFYGVEFKGSID